MSTSREQSAADRLIGLISHWLAGHVDDAALLLALEELRGGELEPGQEEAVEELREELREGRSRGSLEKTVRETLEALALGA